MLDLEEKVEKEVVGKKVEVDKEQVGMKEELDKEQVGMKKELDKEQVGMNKKDVQGVRPGGRCGRGRRHFLLSSLQRQLVPLSPTD